MYDQCANGAGEALINAGRHILIMANEATGWGSQGRMDVQTVWLKNTSYRSMIL